MFCELLNRGSDGIFRGPTRNRYDFRKGERLGTKEHIVEWKKPKKPEWMEEEAYGSYPATLRIRELKIGGRIYITTLLDHKKYKRKKLSNLYKQRWDAEIHIGSLKTIMGMNILRCKSPEMVKKEIGIYMLAYNMIRMVMIESSCQFSKKPRNLSFKNAVQILNQFMPRLYLVSKFIREKMYNILLEEISKHQVNNRPGRVEPRAVKRRPKPFPRLQLPRKVARQKLLKESNRQKRVA